VTPELYGDEKNPSAIVVRRNYSVDGIKFFSPPGFSQQIGLMTRPQGYLVPAHVHNLVERTIHLTQEVLLIRRGSIQVKLFSDSKEVFAEIILTAGDVILLAHGGHEILMLEEGAAVDLVDRCV